MREILISDGIASKYYADNLNRHVIKQADCSIVSHIGGRPYDGHRHTKHCVRRGRKCRVLHDGEGNIYAVCYYAGPKGRAKFMSLAGHLARETMRRTGADVVWREAFSILAKKAG